MLYTVIVGGMAPNGVINGNTYTQIVYLGISGRHNVKINGFEYNATPVPADGTTGVLVRIDELFARTNPTRSTLNTVGPYNFAFLHTQHIHDIKVDLGIQNLNNYLTFTIITANAATITALDYILYLEIEEETKYLLNNPNA